MAVDSVYPEAIATSTNLPDRVADVDLVTADDMNNVRAFIRDITAELGTEPKGSASDLKTRLAVSLNNDGSLKTGLSVAAMSIETLTAQVIGNHLRDNNTPLQRAVTNSSTSGGNTRGHYAVDLQSRRLSSDQVASGNSSVICGGQSNKTSANSAAIVGGFNNLASGEISICAGGGYNQATAFQTSILGGYQNTASGYYSTISGGTYNTASSYHCSILGGSNNTASNNFATTVGGLQNTVSGPFSAIVGGRSNTASGTYSAALGGKEANATQYGQQAQASGKFSSAGDNQTSTLVLRKQTTDATITNMALDGSSTQIALDQDATYSFFVLVTARRTDANDESAAYKLEFCADRNTSGNAALVGSVAKTVIAEDSASWDVTVDADSTNIRIRVTGEAGKTIRWIAFVRMTEVHG